MRSLPLGGSKEVGRDDDQKEVEDEESERDLIFNGMEKSSPIAVSRPTSGDIFGAIEISTEGRHKLVRTSPARLTLWRIEPGELVRFTIDLKPVEFGANHRAYNASERIEVVQPHSRPLSDIGAGVRDTTRSRKDGYQARVEQDGDLNRRGNGIDELGREDDEEKTVASARG